MFLHSVFYFCPVLFYHSLNAKKMVLLFIFLPLRKKLCTVKKTAVNAEIKCTCCLIWIEEKMNSAIELVFVFSQLNIARGAALVGWMKARTFFFIPFFIISLLFLCPNYLAGGLQWGPCVTSACKHSGMCLIGLKEMYVLKFIILPDSSLPPAPSLGWCDFKWKSAWWKRDVIHRASDRSAAKPRSSASSFVDPDFFSPYKSCNFDECCWTAEGLLAWKCELNCLINNISCWWRCEHTAIIQCWVSFQGILKKLHY